MKGATYAVLSEGIKAMRAFYAADESRLITHLLWFGTLLTTEERYYDPMTQTQHYTRHLTFLYKTGLALLSEPPCKKVTQTGLDRFVW